MGVAMYRLIRPLLFLFDAEKAHTFTLALLSYLPKFFFKTPVSRQKVQAFGIEFPHPVGLAAGLDKNGDYLTALSKLGFSFIEVGTITPKPQPGNPKPRLFRIAKNKAIINKMGFNNDGVAVLIHNIKKSNYTGILGINIGKNKDTPLDRAHEDYVYCLQKVYPYASYITINISSPNTPELRQLQQANFLDALLAAIVYEQQKLAQRYQRWVPLVLKISPDESEATLRQIAEIVLKYKISGIIATNTTNARPSLSASSTALPTGGLSGAPLLAQASSTLKFLKQILGDKVCLIGVGGIISDATGQDKLDNGAKLIQVYTGLIYEGPKLVGDLIRNLRY